MSRLFFYVGHLVVSQVSDRPSTNQASVEVIDIDEKESFFDLSKGYVALTFGDGPSALTKQFVDILTEQKVAATFLFVGQKLERNRDAVIYASEHGMAIGNHSWDHRLQIFTSGSGRKLVEDKQRYRINDA